jgi:hypothetical protein
MSPTGCYWTALVVLTLWELARPVYLIGLGTTLLIRALRNRSHP